MPETSKTSATKRPYRSQAELSRLVLDEGVECLLREGIDGARNITLSLVLTSLSDRGQRVAKGSVLGPGRIWRSQGEFQVEVLRRYIRRFTSAGNEIDETVSAGSTVVGAFDVLSPSERPALLSELLRVGGEANFKAMLDGRGWVTWIAVWATVMSGRDDPVRASLMREISDGDNRISADMTVMVYQPLIELVGLRIKDEFQPDGMRAFSLAAMAFADGLAMRGQDAIVYVDRPDVVTGEALRWHPFSIGLEALVHQYFTWDT